MRGLDLILKTGGAALRGGAFDPASLFTKYVGAWYDATSPANMTVNSDGTGGAPALNGTVGRLLDKSGNGLHLSNATAAERPYAKSGYLSFPYEIGSSRKSLLGTVNAISAWDAQDQSGMFIADMPINNTGTPLDLDATGITGFILWATNSVADGQFRIFNGSIKNTGGLVATTKCAVVWRSSASGFEFCVNGTQYNIAALAVDALSSVILGRQGGGANCIMRFREAIILKTAISASDFTALNDYAISRVQNASQNNDVLVTFGDSLFCSAGSVSANMYASVTTQMLNAKRFNVSREGYFIVTPLVPAATLNTTYKGSGKSVCVIWLGTNDIITSGATAANTNTSLSNYATTLRGAGWKVVVCTLQDFTTNRAVKDSLNTLIRGGSYYDAIADLAARSELSNNADTTYFCSDGVHLTDAGHAVVQAVIDTAVASV